MEWWFVLAGNWLERWGLDLDSEVGEHLHIGDDGLKKVSFLLWKFG